MSEFDRQNEYARRAAEETAAKIIDPKYLKSVGQYPIVTDPPSKLISDYPRGGEVKVDQPRTIAEFANKEFIVPNDENGGGADG